MAKAKVKRLKVALIFGGQSAEHEVSIRSPQNVFKAIDKKRYEVTSIGINRKGEWIVVDPLKLLEGRNLFKGNKSGEHVTPCNGKGEFVVENGRKKKKFDVVFPILHGPLGEDGTIQGMLKLSRVAFVGSGVLGSAVGMDKDVMKRLFRDAGLPIVPFLVFEIQQKSEISFKKVKEILGLPFFVKPANLGSSVGISKIQNKKQFPNAIKKAFLYDSKIVLEKGITDVREIECSVLGNEHPQASVLGEITPKHEFYSYEAKYIDDDGAAFIIPANLNPALEREIREMAIKAFKVLCCEGMGRVDFFITREGRVFVNEINTIPGFTAISMYPKLWEQSGIAYSKLIDNLIELSLKCWDREQHFR